MKIERDKVYLTRCGEKVRVVCVDAGAYMPVVGVDEDNTVIRFQIDGAFLTGAQESNCDLVSEYVEPPKPREVWVYPYSDGTGYGSAMTDAERAEHLRTDPNYAAKLVKFREVIE